MRKVLRAPILFALGLLALLFVSAFIAPQGASAGNRNPPPPGYTSNLPAGTWCTGYWKTGSYIDPVTGATVLTANCVWSTLKDYQGQPYAGAFQVYPYAY